MRNFQAMKPGVCSDWKALLFSVLCVLSGLVGGSAYAESIEFSGQVVAVLDGDTLDVLVDRRTERVRLAEIDAPEKAQPFGQRSKQALATLVFGKRVIVRGDGKDRYGRVIGLVDCEGQQINREMVSKGMAWAYRQYLHDQSLLQVEEQARSRRDGLWFDAQPTPPWEWRRR